MWRCGPRVVIGMHVFSVSVYRYCVSIIWGSFTVIFVWELFVRYFKDPYLHSASNSALQPAVLFGNRLEIILIALAAVI